MSTDLTQLGSYGLIGVMLALIALTGSAILILYKVVSNHMLHDTEAKEKLSNSIEKLSAIIQLKL